VQTALAAFTISQIVTFIGQVDHYCADPGLCQGRNPAPTYWWVLGAALMGAISAAWPRRKPVPSSNFDRTVVGSILYGATASRGGRRKRNVTSELYRAARLSNDISTLASGDPRRITRRAKNKLVGRSMGRAGVWRRLWK
jgi:hypothetical protein